VDRLAPVIRPGQANHLLPIDALALRNGDL